MDFFLKDEDRFVLCLRERLLNKRGGVVFSDGYLGHCHQRYFYNSELGKVPSREIKETADGESEPYGEWVSVIEREDGFEIKTDYFGFYRLYYLVLKQGEGGLVISNCFNSLSDYALKVGFDVSIDNKSLFPILSSADVFFANNYSTATANERIKSLRPDQKIFYCANSNGVEIRNRNSISNDLDLVSLMKRGKDHLVKSVNELSPFSINLFFSGGNDSRVCLSILMATVEKEKIRLTTAIPTGKEGPNSYKTLVNDFKVANFIKNEIGLEWYKDEFRGSLEFSPENYINYISKYRSNSYFSRLALGNRVACSSSPEDPEMQVRGGAGEVLRVSALYKGIAKKVRKYGKLINSSDSVEADLSLVFDAICPSDNINTSLHKGSKDYFVNYVREYEGENVEEKLNHRFFLERNSRHFGHHREALAFGKRTFFPLANPYWYMAAKKFSLDERENKEFIKLIFEEFDSSVAELPFSGDAASKNFDFEEGAEVYKKIKAQQPKVHNHPAWKSGCGLGMEAYVKKEIYGMISDIRDYGVSGNFLMNDSMIDFLSSKAEIGGVALLSTYMKVRSVYDAIQPSVTSYKVYS